ALGRAVHYVSLTAESYANELVAHGLPSDEAVPIATLIADVLDGRNSSLTDGVQRALGRPPRDFSDYARATAAAGIWNREEAAA
ncbi:MAG: NmrA family transcriptional regulator, partial [Thiohalocapsa sp.]